VKHILKKEKGNRYLAVVVLVTVVLASAPGLLLQIVWPACPSMCFDFENGSTQGWDIRTENGDELGERPRNVEAFDDGSWLDRHSLALDFELNDPPWDKAQIKIDGIKLDEEMRASIFVPQDLPQRYGSSQPRGDESSHRFHVRTAAMRSTPARRQQGPLATGVAFLALIGSGMSVSACTSEPPGTSVKPPSAGVVAAAHGESGPSPLRGFGFSPFRDCQSPERGVFPTMTQMREDVDTIHEMGNAVRTYSSLNGADQVVRYAHQIGLRVSAGASLGPETTPAGRTANRNEIDALVSLARSTPVESVIVGNEVILRGDLSPHQLAEYLREVKHRLPNVTVTTAEIAGVATLPKNREVIEAVDALMAHIYPYWEGVGIDDAAWSRQL
jgi:exo-beta-1,3-glucanase (GH17 family)